MVGGVAILIVLRYEIILDGWGVGLRKSKPLTGDKAVKCHIIHLAYDISCAYHQHGTHSAIPISPQVNDASGVIC